MKLNKDYENWIKETDLAKAENLTHKIYSRNGKEIRGEIETKELLSLAFEAGEEHGFRRTRKMTLIVAVITSFVVSVVVTLIRIATL